MPHNLFKRKVYIWNDLILGTGNELKKNLLQNPLVAKEYDMLRPEFAIAQALISARIKAHMTQAEVAKSMHTSQSQVARLESGDHLPSLKSIHSYAKAIKHSITLEISAQ